MLNSPKSLACLSAEKQVDDCQFKLSKNLISNFNFLTEQLKKEVFSTENKNNCLYFLLNFYYRDRVTRLSDSLSFTKHSK